MLEWAFGSRMGAEWNYPVRIVMARANCFHYRIKHNYLHNADPGNVQSVAVFTFIYTNITLKDHVRGSHYSPT